MSNKSQASSTNLSLLSVPAFWPMVMATAILETGSELAEFYYRDFKFLAEDLMVSIA
jgi:hypothetical protein